MQKELVLSILFCIYGYTDSRVYVRQRGQSVVQIEQGHYRGVMVEFPSGVSTKQLESIEGFIGLKYASLRGGKLRYFIPTSVLQKGSYMMYIQEAFEMTAVCPQKIKWTNEKSKSYDESDKKLETFLRLSKNQEEDCLYLNLYVPKKDWTDTTPFPVMVFVHGESYEFGTGNAYDGSVLASYGKVIVVTVNYRLGVLGFLNTGSSEASGNQALLDLLAVLDWIQENIASFHGDPNRVTMFGHGHGAALVNILLLSPLAKQGKLFHRAILQSGSALSSWAVSFDPKYCASQLARNVNCSRNDSRELLACLKSRTADELVNHSPTAPKYYSCMAPTPNGKSIFPRPITELLNDNNNVFSTANIMLGVTKNEAYSYLKQDEMTSGISEKRKTQIIRTFVQNNFKYNRQRIFEVLDHEYSSWDRAQTNFTRRDNVLQLLSDGLYVAPLMQIAKRHSATGETYMYAFGHATDVDKYHDWSSASQGDDLPYVFGAPLVDGISPFQSQYTEQEKRLSATMMTYWTNFAKTGNPNMPENVTLYGYENIKNPIWTTFQQQSQNYMYFDDRAFPKHHYKGKELSLWLDLIPRLNEPEVFSNTADQDPAINELEDWKNMSTFDDPHLLISDFLKIFPTQPPIPPMPPIRVVETQPRDQPPKDVSITSERKIIKDAKTKPTSKDELSRTKKDSSNVKETPSRQIKSQSGQSSSVPLSITVAVGCSLLFINIILFAAVYYQRRRIQRLSITNTATHNGNSDNDLTNAQGNTNLKASTDDQNQLTPSSGEGDLPNIQSNPLYSVISKSNRDSPHRSSRDSVSTDSSLNVRHKNIKNQQSDCSPSLSIRNKMIERGKEKDPVSKFNHIDPRHLPNSTDTSTVV